MRRSLFTRFTLATVLAGVLIVPAAPALSLQTAPAAAEDDSSETVAPGTTWALQPAGEEGPDGRVSLRHTIEAGQAASDRLAVTNFGEQPARFAIYASDGTITADGSFDLIPNDSAPIDGGAWIELGAVAGSQARDGGGLEIQVPAASVVTIPVAISVPADATPGDHPAGIVAELLPDDGSTVQLASRVGVRVHLRVDGDIVAALAPQAVSAGYTPSWNPFAPGTVTVTYTLANSGNVRLGADVATSISGPFGIGERTVSGQEREVLPGDGVPITAQAEVWPLFFHSGEIAVVPLVVGDDVVEVPIDTTTAGFTAWTIPWSQLILIVAVAGLVVLVVRMRGRSRRRMQERIDAAVAAATASAAQPAQSTSPDAGDQVGTGEPLPRTEDNEDAEVSSGPGR